MNELLSNYLPIIIFVGLAAVIGLALMIAPFIVAYKRPDPEKVSAFEAGFEAFDDARHGKDMKAMMLLEKEVQAGLKAQTANAGNAISKADFQTAAQEIRACLFLEKFLADIAVFDE